MIGPTARLDITADVCPMTWVKTRLELEDLDPGDVLEVLVRAGESHHNVVTNAQAEGHAVEGDEAAAADIRRLLIRCGA